MLMIGGCFAVGASAEGEMTLKTEVDPQNLDITVVVENIPDGFTVEKKDIAVEIGDAFVSSIIKGGGNEFVIQSLEAGKTYKITVTANSGSTSVKASADVALKKSQQPPTNVNLQSRTTTSIIVSPVSGAEYGIVEAGKDASSVVYQDSNELKPENPSTDIYYDIYVRYKETADKFASAGTKVMSTKLLKAGGADAVAVKVTNVTDTEITLKKIDGYEYSKDYGKTFQDSNVFSGLTKGTLYHICQRKKADNDSEVNKTSAFKNVMTNTGAIFTVNTTQIKAPELEGKSVYFETDNVVKAYGSQRRNGSNQWGDEQYIPDRYELYKDNVKESEGKFTLKSNENYEYNATFSPKEAGNYKLKVIYAKQRWEGVDVQYITVDNNYSRELTFKVTKEPSAFAKGLTTLITFLFTTLPKYMTAMFKVFKALLDNYREHNS